MVGMKGGQRKLHHLADLKQIHMPGVADWLSRDDNQFVARLHDLFLFEVNHRTLNQLFD